MKKQRKEVDFDSLLKCTETGGTYINKSDLVNMLNQLEGCFDQFIEWAKTPSGNIIKAKSREEKDVFISPLHFIIMCDDLRDYIPEMFKSEYDINHPTSHGHTPWTLLYVFDDVEMMELLLQHPKLEIDRYKPFGKWVDGNAYAIVKQLALPLLRAGVDYMFVWGYLDHEHIVNDIINVLVMLYGRTKNIMLQLLPVDHYRKLTTFLA